MQARTNNTVKQLEEARKKCRASLEKQGDNAAALHLMGVIEYQLGHTASALQWLKKALAVNSRSAELQCNYAKILASQNKWGEAIAAFRRAIELQPDDAGTHSNLGSAFRKCGDDDNAIMSYRSALALNPALPEVHNNLGVILQDKGQLPEAEKCFRRALELRPAYPLPLNNLGVISYSLGQLKDAEEYHRRALALKPDYPDALNNLGKILRHKGALADSIALYRQALALQPDFPEALNNLGNALRDSGMPADAIAAYEQAIALKPDNPDFRHNLSMALLAAGRFTEGWNLYEWRWRTAQLAAAKRDMAKPLWRGEVARGQTLLIRAEQGFGDTLQFCRYVPLAAAQGLRVILQVQPALAGLLKSLEGVEQVIVYGQPLPEFDLYCHMLSLPLAFKTQLDTIPAAVPYLSPEPENIAKWKSRLTGDDNRLKAGLVWAGSGRRHSPDLVAVDRRRSIDPGLLAPLMDIAGVRFYSLQKEGRPAPGEFGLIDRMGECRDFADTAALIANLDLVISVDTAVAHLAGALGKPVWVLNRFDSCWRWLQDRQDSPWYPTLRLFRQPQPGDWESVVSRVRQELTGLCRRE